MSMLSLTRRSPFLPATAAVIALVLGAACSSSSDSGAPEAEEQLGVTCEGKCDGWGSIKSLWRDARQLDLGDLAAVGAGFASDQLNDALAVSDYAGLKLGEPKVYTTADKAADDLTLGNLDQLTTGLATAFGERELTTQVNRVRRDHLSGTGDDYYGEFAFQLTAGLGHGWNLPVKGLGSDVTVGFDSNANLSARVIGAFPTELGAIKGAPLKAMRAGRGFVIPRSVDDVRSMKPGELVALGGSGGLGLNVGVGVPLLIASPVPGISYNLVVSAGLRTHLRGQLDVQLVRLEGDQVVVDVGVTQADVMSASVALNDGWGVQGLLKSSVAVGGLNLDLGKLVEKALSKQMNARLNFISARAEKTKQSTRLSVARMRFMLDGATDAALLEQALAQALRGDVRLAQALSAAGDPGVIAEFDLSRSGVSATSHAGVDIFGMSFFKSIEEASGSVVVQTPGGSRTLLFDSLHDESGWFFSSHGYTRVGMSGLVFDPSDPKVPAFGEANLFLQVEEGDDYMERDKLLDNLDAVIQGLGGEAALTAIEGPGNELQRFVTSSCPNSQAGDPCRTTILSDSKVIKLRADGEAALASAIGGLEPAARELVMQAGKLRLAAQATVEPGASLVGPPTSVVLDVRLDDATLATLLADDKEYAFKSAVGSFLRAVEIDRGDTASEITKDRAAIPAAGDRAVIDEMTAEYKNRALSYQKLLAAEKAIIQNIGSVGPRALEIRFPVDASKRPDYENATAASLSQARAREAIGLFDRLLELADDLGPHAEQPVVYALLAMTPSARSDVRLNVDMNLSSTWAQDYSHYKTAGYAPFDKYARGSQVQSIDGGLFDVQALLNVK